MRIVQIRILNDILDKIVIPDYIHAFEKGRSIPAMANIHTNKKIVFSVDIKDFFPSIKQLNLEGIFVNLGIGQAPARTLSELCTYKAYLPQGALTSPKLSNMVSAMTFGPALKEFCDAKGLTLSIYADDITISANPEFTTRDEYTVFIREVLNKINEEVSKWHFRVNREKTKVMFDTTRQWVCGVVVNEKTNMIRRERSRLRAIVHNCQKNGIPTEAAKAKMTEIGFVRKYLGRLNWYCQLNPAQAVKLHAPFKAMAKDYQKQFPDFEIPELAYTASEGHEAEAELLPEHGTPAVEAPPLVPVKPAPWDELPVLIPNPA